MGRSVRKALCLGVVAIVAVLGLSVLLFGLSHTIESREPAEIAASAASAAMSDMPVRDDKAVSGGHDPWSTMHCLEPDATLLEQLDVSLVRNPAFDACGLPAIGLLWGLLVLHAAMAVPLAVLGARLYVHDLLNDVAPDHATDYSTVKLCWRAPGLDKQVALLSDVVVLHGKDGEALLDYLQRRAAELRAQ